MQSALPSALTRWASLLINKLKIEVRFLNNYGHTRWAIGFPEPQMTEFYLKVNFDCREVDDIFRNILSENCIEKSGKHSGPLLTAGMKTLFSNPARPSRPCEVFHETLGKHRVCSAMHTYVGAVHTSVVYYPTQEFHKPIVATERAIICGEFLCGSLFGRIMRCFYSGAFCAFQ